MSEKRKRTSFIGLRMTPAEDAAVRKAAAEEGISVPEFIRNATRAWIALHDEFEW
jgi:uncharacterized protein (DUF1778 family)